MEKLSATIITYNEEENIERCLKSLVWADEIVVLDTFSTDRTLEICRRYTDNIYQDTFHGYGKQKNLCAEKTSYRWILNVDADEVISDACAREIRRELSGEPRHPCYDFPRRNYFGDRWVRYAGWYPDRIIRLYDKERVAFSEVLVHEKLVPDSDSGSLNEALIHYSFRDMDDFILRQMRYSTLFAKDRVNNGWRAGWSDLVFRPPWVFFKTLILRQGYREGLLGLFISVALAFYTFLKYAKTRMT